MQPIKVSALNKGDEVYECAQIGGSLKTRVLAQPKHVDGKWTFRGLTPEGEQEYLVTDGYEHYGPRFYKEPVYFPITEFDLEKTDGK